MRWPGRGTGATPIVGTCRSGRGCTGSRPTPAWTPSSGARGSARLSRHPLGPLPGGLDLVADEASSPEARYDARESISIAFATVLQVLPPRQRAVLILRDVLGWHASEVAELLEISVPAVNSALHRARATLSRSDPRLAGREPPPASPSTDPSRSVRALLERYLQAWEAADIAGLVALLRDDAVLAMPPELTIPGRPAIAAFFAEAIFVEDRRFHLVEIKANGGPGVRGLGTPRRGRRLSAVRDHGADTRSARRPVPIARIDAFRDPRLFATFGLPAEWSPAA